MTSNECFVLTVPNAHVGECGQPPQITAGKSERCYTGYFENQYGEQLVVQIDRTAKVGVLRMGDLGWGKRVVIDDDQIADDVALSQEEFDWLALCWREATGGELEKPFMLAIPDIIKQINGRDPPESSQKSA